jgi:hypothetical protein
MDDIFVFERAEGEDFETYKQRRRDGKKAIKDRLKPRTLWPTGYFGTYSHEKAKRILEENERVVT